MDEWGQIVLMNALLRYARTQFLEPPERSQDEGRMSGDGGGFSGFGGGDEGMYSKPMTLNQFYEDDEEDEDAKGGKGGKKSPKKRPTLSDSDEDEDEAEKAPKYEMDKDHKLLLRSSLPLLKSRNSGVVLAVSSLYYYLGSGSPTVCSKVGRALVRELKNQREITFVVLANIAQMAERWPNMFRYLATCPPARCPGPWPLLTLLQSP